MKKTKGHYIYSPLMIPSRMKPALAGQEVNKMKRKEAVENLQKQNKALNLWAGRYLGRRRNSCGHHILTQASADHRLQMYCRCADYGRTIKLRFK